MKTIIISLSFIFLSYISYSQELLFFNNIKNPMQFNPAATGLIYKNRIAASSQFWISSFDNSPFTTQINYEKSIDSTAFGYGILAMNDIIGFIDSQFLSGIFRYSFVNQPNFKLALGTAAKFSSWHLNPKWNTFNADIKNDPFIPKKHRSNYLYLTTGLWLKTERLNAGISMDNMWLNFKQTDYIFSSSNYYHAFFSYNIFSYVNFTLQPDFLFESDGSYNMKFYGINATLYKNYCLGLKLRDDFTLISSIGYRYKKIGVDISALILNDILKYLIITGIQLSYSFE